MFTSFSQDDICKIIQNLNPNKAHGHDNISIWMLKICGSSIYGPLELIFKEALSAGLFPSNLKKGNIVPIHRKGDKQILKNYRPFSLLPIYGKIFERPIFNELCNVLLENNLILPNQSGIRLGDSCINQLSSITHKIYNSFDPGLEKRSIFLDIFKAWTKPGGNMLLEETCVFWFLVYWKMHKLLLLPCIKALVVAWFLF